MLTDEDFERIAKPFLSNMGDHWCNQEGIRNNGAIEDFARAVIEANNKKVLADFKPVGNYSVTTYKGYENTEFQPEVDFAVGVHSLHSADQVSAILQRNEALEAKVKELNDLLAKSLVNNMNLKEQL